MKIIFTPSGFLLADLLIELFSFIILVVFFFLSMRSYKLTKNKKSLLLGTGFFLIAFAELATILTKFVLYYDTTFTQNVGRMIITYHVVKSVDFIYEAGFFMQKFLTLLGLYVLYLMYNKTKPSKDLFLTVFFIVVSAAVSQIFYYVYHLSALIILLLILPNYLRIYQESEHSTTKMLIWAFSLLALSQFIFILSPFAIPYITAQLLQLTSYFILLFLILKVLKYETPKPKRK